MLFTTPAFVLVFLPLALLGFYALGRRRPYAAAAWLFAASLYFYSHWRPIDTLLLLLSIGMNFWFGRRIVHGGMGARGWMVAGVAFDLALLATFKYGDFVIANLNELPGVAIPLPGLTLPIGISFYTFTQIAFLVDAYRHRLDEPRPIHYGLFVTYFPHLVAGPVLHHAQMMPQFADRSIYRWQRANIAAGLAIFFIGLFKKVFVADGVSPYADAVFNAADGGMSLSVEESWLGAIAYALQLYFDFSGYSDMAIGLSWMFNVRLPFNFNSPYKALNISDFWRRWHISLSTFLRDYLYISLGGNRRGTLRRYLNLAITMVLGGLWHGASWTFVAWGALHGLYLVLHQSFRASLAPRWQRALDASRPWRVFAWLATMLAVLVAWVLFRATTFSGAANVLASMAGLSGVEGPATSLWNAGLDVARGWAVCGVLVAVAAFAPNSNMIGEGLRNWCEGHRRQSLVLAGAALTLVLFAVLVNAARDSVSAFIYFNF
jgi:alginate O-acetyltransferase complex protein AlgI